MWAARRAHRHLATKRYCGDVGKRGIQSVSSVEGKEVDTVKIKRALISVFDKTGLVDLATYLCKSGVELLSTGGTAKVISDAELTFTEVSDFTVFPENLGGRVKSLHPKIHGTAQKEEGARTVESAYRHVRAIFR